MSDKRIRIRKRNESKEAVPPMRREVRFVLRTPTWLSTLLKRPTLIISIIALPLLVFAFLKLYHLDDPVEQDDPAATQSAHTTYRLLYEDHHRLKEGEDLFDAFFSLGFRRAEMTPMIADLEQLIDVDDLGGGLLEWHVSESAERNGMITFTPDPVYYKVNLFYGDSTYVTRTVLETTSEEHVYSHIVSYDNFYESLHRAGFERPHMEALEEALAWSVDFHRIKADSRCKFKVLFKETHLAGQDPQDISSSESLLSAKLLAVEFQLGDETFNYYEYEGNFYDDRGRSARRQFLRAPVKYSRISSYFGSRTHPVTGQVKQHNGIDFAADEGDPIHALSDGVIEIAVYKPNNKENNGNYVKIKHDRTYQTQYLHMSRLADNIRKGTKVRQGDIIGFVGQTGLATGPHVCLRFWKNNIQVDFFREKMSHLKKLAKSDLAAYRRTMRGFESSLNSILY